MALRNTHDLELSTSSGRSVERYDAALTLLAGYFLDPLAEIDRALSDDRDFVSGHCLRAALGVLAAERSGGTSADNEDDSGTHRRRPV